MSRMTNYFDAHSGLWSFIQLSGIIVAIISFILTQYYDREKSELERIDRLINARNSINYLVRYIPVAVGFEKNDDSKEKRILTMKKCLERVNEIDIYNLYPSEFSEGIVALQIEGENALSAIENQISDQEKWKIIQITSNDLRRMTEYIKSQVEIIGVDKGAIRRK